MSSESVVFVHSVTCPSCGLQTSRYLELAGDGKGTTSCPRCGALITQVLPANYVTQIPPADFNSPSHPSMHVSHYPGLYSQPKHAPRLDFADLVRIAYSPTRAFANLYLSTNLQRALALVVVFSIVSALASILVTADMGEVLGYSRGDAFEMAVQGFVSWIVSVLAFLIFGVTAALIAKDVFGGRGERSMTMALVGYCYPAYVLLSLLLLALFDVGFQGLDLSQVQDWTDQELDQAIAAGAALIIVAFVGVVWLLWIVSKAVSVSNDVSVGEGVLTSILAAILAGLVYLAVGSVMRLPMGLSL